MSHLSLSLTAALAALVVVRLLAQAPAANKPWTMPRTLDGQPDLQGIWGNGTLTPLERPKSLGTKEFYTDQEFAELAKRARKGNVGEEGNLGVANPDANPLRYDLSLYGFDVTKMTFASNKRTSLIVGPEGVIPPVLADARKRNAERTAQNRGHEFDSAENRPIAERCVLMAQERIPMLPGDNNPLQIVQGKGYVAMLHEQDHSTRVIPTNARPHLPQSVRQLQGDSVGHWEGDTLVVDTTNFTDRAPFRGASEKLHLVERFTRTAGDTVTYRFTVEDPTTWDKPWTAEIPMTRTKGPIYEFTCHEANYELPNILRGARVGEEEAAGKAAK
jgi:hypothetical protein